MIDPADFVLDFARGIAAADARAPQAVGTRSGLPYQPGIGPHTEASTVSLVMKELHALEPKRYGAFQTGVPYPALPRQRCDLCLGSAGDWSWVVEVKMLRLMGDNGKLNDNMLMHILSPYPAHRSALTDCAKLLDSEFTGRKAIVIYGFEYEGWALAPALDAFEVLASQQVRLGPRATATFSDLIHPIHREGKVLGWELLS
jgi:hypothetical protein